MFAGPLQTPDRFWAASFGFPRDWLSRALKERALQDAQD